MTAARRIVAAAAIALGGALLAAPHVVSACDQYSCTPVVSAVTPSQVAENGKPVHITLQGYGFTGVTQVMVTPVVPVQGFSVFNDSTILVNLPADTAPGIYAVRVVSPSGGSDPSLAPQFQVFAAVPPSQAPTPTPKPTPTPVPTPTPKPPAPETGVFVPVGARSSGSGGSGGVGSVVAAGGTGQVSPASAPIDIMVGLALGAVIYLLWGSPRRLSGSWRSAPMLHFLGRPVQALHIGRICLYCGSLHYIWNTRSDLWKEARYCGPKCFISAEAMPSPLADEDEPEPVAEHKKAAWWRAAVATDQGSLDLGDAATGDGQTWRPRF